MSDQEELLSKNALMIIGVLSVIVFIVGMILLALGYNEAFYIEDPLVRTVFEIITNLGSDIAFIVIIAILYIIYDKRFAKNLGFNLLLSGYLNAFIKDIFQDPRPPANRDPSEEYGYIETTYGFPSGHTQSAVTVWGYIAYEFKDKPRPYIVPIILSILIFLISISRMIIGVHDLEDVIGGYIIGICFLIVFIYLEPLISPQINKLSLSMKLLIAIVVSVLLFTIAVILFPTSGLELVKNAPPYADEGSFGSTTGAMLGLSVGYLLESEYVKYEPSELNKKQKCVNLIIGLIILVAIYFGLGLIVRGNIYFRFIRYALVAFILTFLAPLIFTKINRK
ncbi:MAG: phosphatase PAP2 family protein [Promethearchaeota archaeon]|nr:MAG: phosphatase PAP2 family protein [Candidatus Lokiarchaeota archaeon]